MLCDIREGLAKATESIPKSVSPVNINLSVTTKCSEVSGLDLAKSYYMWPLSTVISNIIENTV